MKVGIYLLMGFMLMVGSGCRSSNPHHGLYNALFYDYDKRLKQIDENLSRQQERENRLQVQYNRAESVTREKEKRFHNIENNLSQLSGHIEEINARLNGIEYDKKLFKIKEIIREIREEINNQKIFKEYVLNQRRKVNREMDSALMKIDKGENQEIKSMLRETIDETKLYLQYVVK